MLSNTCMFFGVLLLLRVSAFGPVPNPTQSYWLQHEELQDYRSFPTLPSKAETVVIGAGISGVATSYGLTVEHNRSVLLLDARGVSGGASGRNSGGVGAGIDYADAVRRWGKPRAAELLQHSNSEFQELITWITKHCGPHCDLHVHGSVDLYQNSSAFRAAAAADSEQQRAGFGANTSVWNASTCASQTGALGDDFAGCVFHSFGGTLWVSRFVVAIAKRALSTGRLNLQTHTLVQQVKRATATGTTGTAAGTTGGGWEVQTNRGTIIADQV